MAEFPGGQYEGRCLHAIPGKEAEGAWVLRLNLRVGVALLLVLLLRGPVSRSGVS